VKVFARSRPRAIIFARNVASCITRVIASAIASIEFASMCRAASCVISTSAGAFDVITAAAQAIDSAIAKATRLLRSPVTIESVTLEADGEATLSVRELQAFVIRASLIHHEPTPGVSVNINIIRSDGAYVFYQPSGLEGRNIVDFEGRSEIRFHFDPNPFGSGEYEVNLFAVNAFSWDNIPPSEIYDRSIGRWRAFAERTPASNSDISPNSAPGPSTVRTDSRSSDARATMATRPENTT